MRFLATGDILARYPGAEMAALQFHLFFSRNYLQYASFTIEVYSLRAEPADKFCLKLDDIPEQTRNRTL